MVSMSRGARGCLALFAGLEMGFGVHMLGKQWMLLVLLQGCMCVMCR